MLNWFTKIDLMVRVLLVAIVLAAVFPAVGAGRQLAQHISNIGIFLLFFLNGIRLSRGDVARGVRNWRFLFPLAIWCFGVMAIAGWGIWVLNSQALPPLIALGFLYLGVLPSTVQSATAYTSLAGGNVASSVVSAAFLNVLGVFVSATIFAWLSAGEALSLGYDGLGKIFMILILPFALGQLLQSRLRGWLVVRPKLVGWMDRVAIAVAVYVAFSGAVEQGIWNALSAGGWTWLLLLIGLLTLFAFAGAWALAVSIGLPRDEKISFTFAGAHKSVAMGAPLALVIFEPKDAGLILVPLLIYHLVQLIVSAPLASYFSKRQQRH